MKTLSATLGACCIACFCIIPLHNVHAAPLPENKGAAETQQQEGEFSFDDIEQNTPGSEDSRTGFTLKGHFRNLFTWIKVNEYSESGEEKSLAANLSRIRFSPEFTYSDILLVHADLDNETVFGSYLGSREFDGFWRDGYSNYNDMLHLTRDIHYDDDILYRAKVHRAYMKLSVKSLTVTAGRQLVRFGSGRLWNPLDIMNPLSPLSLEGAEDQKGTDALRTEFFFNEYTVLSLVLSQNREYDRGEMSEWSSGNTSAVGRFKTSILPLETEIAVIGGRLIRKNLGGADISTIIMGGTLRGSWIYLAPDDYRSYTQGSAGYEYNFRCGLYVLMEYFYNRNGINYNEELRSAYMFSQAYGIDETTYYILSNQFLTWNRHYGGLALGYDLHPLVRAELFTIWDVQGRGVFLNPSLKINPLQDVDIVLSVMQGHVFDGARHASDFEYLRDYPLVYASLTWYFL